MESRGTTVDPGDSQPLSSGEQHARRDRWIAHVLALCLGVLGLICSLALPFASTWNDRTEVHWPSAHAPAASTTALFAPYRPAEFAASVPCPVIRSALARPAPATLLTTVPPGSARDGMALRTTDGKTRLVLGQREIPLPASADCGITVRADASGSQVRVGGAEPISLPGIAAPEIATFTTDLAPPQAAQLSVTARTFSWFDTSPTSSKHTLITSSLLLAVVSLILLLVHARPSIDHLRDAMLRRRSWSSVATLPIDAAMAVLLAGWGVIGPLTDDDGFAIRTILNYGPSGDIGNYYRWFNASETPFTLVQNLMRWVADFSQAPVFLRLPSVVAGLLTWLVVSRGIVMPLCRGTRQVPVHLLTAVSFLACWLPFGVGIRPEPFIALGASAVVAMLFAATSETSRSPFFWLGAAAAVSGLTVAVTPTGIAVLFTVLAFAPRIVRLLRSASNMPAWIVVPTRVVLVACAGSMGLTAIFADSTLNGVEQANTIHNEFGPSMGWYQEITRYEALLGTNSWGAEGKRITVFLVITALVIATGCVLRNLHRATRMSDTPLLIASVAGVFATLWLTPSKWSHHFGALAGVGSALLAVAIVQLTRVGRLPWASREARILGVLGTLAAAAAAGLSFTGPNRWWRYSGLAMPWSDTPVRPMGVHLDSPVLWIVVGLATGALVFAIITIRRLQGQRTGVTAAAWTAGPAAVLTFAALASVMVLAGSFVAAPATLGDHFSVARTNWKSITGHSCGLEDEVETLPLAAGGPLRPSGDPTALDGFTANALPGAPPSEPALREKEERDPSKHDPGKNNSAKNNAGKNKTGKDPAPVQSSPFQWSSLAGGPGTTGSMRSGWFDLPPLRGDQAVSVWVSGRPQDGNDLGAEFGTAHGRGTQAVGVHELRDPPPTELPYKDPKQGRPRHWRDFRSWRLLTIEARDVPPGADRIRLHATDRTTDPQGYLSVSGPAVRDVVPLHKVLARRKPALIDWPINFLFPCHADYPRVGHGTAESPRLLISPPEGEGSMAFDPHMGGVFAGVLPASERYETPSRVRGEPGVIWGHVFSVHYDSRRDVYDTRDQRVRVGGSDGDVPYPFKRH